MTTDSGEHCRRRAIATKPEEVAEHVVDARQRTAGPGRMRLFHAQAAPRRRTTGAE